MIHFLKKIMEGLWLLSPGIILVLASSLYLVPAEEADINGQPPAGENISKTNTPNEVPKEGFLPILFPENKIK